MSDFTITRQPMVCASAQAEGLTYQRVNGKAGSIWLIAIQPNSADNIYVWRPGPSDGFAGRTLYFTLENGCVLPLKGPWHSSSEALFKNTGIDIRDKHLTFGVIARKREYDSALQEGKLVDVIHHDVALVISNLNRIVKMAQQLANERRETVYYYSQSPSGSVCSKVGPVHM